MRATTKEQTPELELLESTRMLGAAIISADVAKARWRSCRGLAGTGEEEPRVANLAEGYVAVAKGIWSAHSPASLSIRRCMHEPLLWKRYG